MSLIQKASRINNESIAVAKERLETCKKCKFYDKTFGTCGTIYKGGEVTYRKKKYKLCGCVMYIKTKLPWSECPVGKWTAFEGWGTEHIEEVKTTLENYKANPKKYKQDLNAVFKKICGDACNHINLNEGCPSCMRTRVSELEKYVRKVEKC